MKKLSTLIIIGILAWMNPLMAQDTVSSYGWEDGTNFGPIGSNWNNDGVTWVHETVTGDADAAHSGEGYFKATVAEVPPNQWDNQGVFQEIAIEDETSYRFGFWMRAEGDAPMINITSGTYNGWKEIQRKGDLEIGPDWKYYSLMLYVTNSEDLDLIDAEGRYEDTIRFPIHYYGTGTYFLDDVIIAKSTIAGVSYNDDVLAVDFGYFLDYTAAVSPDAFTITVDGSVVAATNAVMVIEGTSFEPKVYMELSEVIAEGSVVLVDYDGGEDIFYSSYSPPTDATYKALAFEGEAAFYDPSLVVPQGSAIKSSHSVQFKVSPNPVVDQLTISSSVKISAVSIFDLTGKMIQESVNQRNVEVSMDVSDLITGLYMVQVTDVNGNSTARKFVK